VTSCRTAGFQQCVAWLLRFYVVQSWSPLIACLLVVVHCLFIPFGNLRGLNGQVESVCKCCEDIVHQLCGSQPHLVGMKPAGRSIGQCHVVETAANLCSDWSCLPVMRLALSNIESPPSKLWATAPCQRLNCCSIFNVTSCWLLGRKKVQCRPGLMSEEQFSRTTLLWKSGAGCRPVSQQEYMQDFIHISLPSQFEEAALEGVDKAFGPSICLGVVRWWQNVIDVVSLTELPELVWGKVRPVVTDNCLWNIMLGTQFTKYCHCLPGRRAGHWNNNGLLWVGVHDEEEVPSQMWTSKVYMNALPRFCCWRPRVQCCLERLLCCCYARPAYTNHFFNFMVHARLVRVFACEWLHS